MSNLYVYFGFEDGSKRKVDKSKLFNSCYFVELLEHNSKPEWCLLDTVNLSEQQLKCYLDFVDCTTITPSTTTKLTIEQIQGSFVIEDNHYTDYCIEVLKTNWSVYKDLMSELPKDLYLRLPYNFLPFDMLVNDDSFLFKWLSCNTHTIFSINNNSNSNSEYGDYLVIADYDYNNRLLMVKPYLNGKLHGLCQGWYPTSPTIGVNNVKHQRSYIESYKDGILDGVATGYYQSGNKIYEVSWCQDKRHGLSQSWFDEIADNGKQRSEEQTYYCHGKKHGTSITWYSNGQLKNREMYYDANLEGTVESWYENGNRMYEMCYKKGKQHGLCQGWHENGDIWFTTESSTTL
jgi:antitoxin component YwqK of YwqJK toxin-antitoxin module